MSPLPNLRFADFAPFLTFRFTFLTLAFRLALRLDLDLGIDIQPSIHSSSNKCSHDDGRSWMHELIDARANFLRESIIPDHQYYVVLSKARYCREGLSHVVHPAERI